MKVNDSFIRQRDNPGALLNVDNEGYKNYRETRKKILENHSKMEQINKLNDEINNIKDDISDIKQLLLKVLESK